MNKETSLYLDLVRFCAALTVFFLHLAFHARAYFSQFWKANIPYLGQTAVSVFFVLSGYVIAHVLATREKALTDYAVSRLARLYSVAIPALILTAICNYFILQRYPELYGGYGNGFGRYLITGLFLSQYWMWPGLTPPNAGPFWSLSFEVAFYIGAGLVVFTTGYVRILGLALLCAAAGPTMMALAPIWVLGYLAYKYSRRFQLGVLAAVFIWAASTVLLLLCSLIGHYRIPFEPLAMPEHDLGGLLNFYASAICFTIGLHAFNSFAAGRAPFLIFLSAPIRWLGSITFALYLFHYPLLSLLTIYRPSHFALAWVVGGTFAVVVTLGYACERSKGRWKQLFVALAHCLPGIRRTA